jgi:hypothetical protein
MNTWMGRSAGAESEVSWTTWPERLRERKSRVWIGNVYTFILFFLTWDRIENSVSPGQRYHILKQMKFEWVSSEGIKMRNRRGGTDNSF